MKTIKIQKEFQIPGTNIVLERGDKIRVNEGISIGFPKFSYKGFKVREFDNDDFDVWGGIHIYGNLEPAYLEGDGIEIVIGARDYPKDAMAAHAVIPTNRGQDFYVSEQPNTWWDKIRNSNDYVHTLKRFIDEFTEDGQVTTVGWKKYY